jgi:murein L,D-transpeptidase YcbB/YkuD
LLAIDQQGMISDSLQIDCAELLEETYYRNDYLPFWSEKGLFRPVINQLIGYLDTVSYDGLFQNDYHYNDIKYITLLLKTDSLKKADAALWTKADLLLTDAFMRVALHLKKGRISPDSSSWLTDSTKYSSFFIPQFNRLFKNEDLGAIIACMHPVHQGYRQLRSLVKPFVDSMDTQSYTYVRYPFIEGNEKDSLRFIAELQLRLSESDFLKLSPKEFADSAKLADAITKYQKKKKLTPDGKYSAALVKNLNLTDKEKYNRLAITLGEPACLQACIARQRFCSFAIENHLREASHTNTTAYQCYIRSGDLSNMDGASQHHQKRNASRIETKLQLPCS